MLSSPNDMQPNSNAPVTKTGAQYINYSETGYFSALVSGYLEANERLLPFYKYSPDINGIKKAIDERKHINYDRETLVAVLKDQYHGITLHPQLEANLELLAQKNTFAVTTAHQPNIFTGPLYFIYKILHAIKLAASLQTEFPANNFVPVFYMGSEDADLDELGHFTVDGKKYEWKTKQTGAVGRMKIDKAFSLLVAELESQLEVQAYGSEIISIFKDAYKEGKTLQQCTLKLVNTLFGKYGLVVLIPDNAALKKLFIPVVKKELTTQFSNKAVKETIEDLGKLYKVQAGGRVLNLFYLLDDKRERIEIEGDKFLVKSFNLAFNEQEIIRELEEHPDRFSPNVILRGVFQETILPNVAFIGGGGELAYWLELKKVFDTVEVPYPVLVLRNSFLVMNGKQVSKLNEAGVDIKDVFRSTDALLNEVTKRESNNKLSFTEEKGELNSYYQQLHESVAGIDASLAEHVAALQANALKKIEALEKKMLRSEKKKFETERQRIEKVKSSLFPSNNLQERVENVSGFYAKYGEDFIDIIYAHSLSLEQQFCVVVI